MGSPGAGGQYRINIVWTSHGGQVLATMGQIQSGMRQVGGTSLREGRNLGYFNRQMQAIGTTMRYFFAGGAIFGTMNAFRQWAEFQSKLGDIAAISPNLNRSQITEIGNTLLQQSTAMATPVQELEESARNIQSTLQDLDPSQITRFTELFSKGALVAETDAYNFGNAIMGMRNAFDLGLGDMERVADEFFQVISLSAGMTGDEWAQFSGRVVAGAGIAGASLEQMNALMVIMTRQGATAATNVRHLAQFLQQLRNPTQESLPFWEDIGLDEETLRTAPFQTILDTLMKAVKDRGGLRQLDTNEINAMEQDLEFMPKDAGGGESLLMDLFGRMESRRAALVVLSQMLNPDRGSGFKTEQGLKSYDELLTIFDQSTNKAENLNAAVERALDRKRVQQFGIAMRNMFTEALNPAERQIAGAASWLTEHADPRLVQGAAAAMLGYGAFKVGQGGMKGLKGMGRFLRGAGGVGFAAESLAGTMPPQGSFASPFWVIIHPLSNIPGGGLGKGGRGGAPVVGPMGGGGGPAGRRLPPIPVTGLATVASAVLMLPNSTGTSDEEEQRNKWLKEMEKNPAKYQRMIRLWNRVDRGDKITSMSEGSIFQQFMAGKLDPKRAERALQANYENTFRHVGESMAGFSRVEESRLGVFVDVSDEAKKLLRVQVSSDDPKRRTRVHVPVGHSAWSGGATPQFRGRPRTIRGGD